MNIHWSGLGNVLLVGLIAGVGLVALFGVGIRLLGQAAEADEPRTATGAATAAGGHARVLTALAYLCFAVCAAVAAYGITLLLNK